MKYFLVLLAILSFKAFSQAAPDELLKILEENSSSACLLQKEPMELCDCSKTDHRKADHKCVTGNCCTAESANVGANPGVSCEKTVQSNYKDALGKAKEAGIETNVSDQ